MRLLALCFIAACGSKPATTTLANTGSAAATPVATDDDGPEDCTSSVESARAGNHDRYAFEGADGLYGYKTKSGVVAIAARLRYAYEFKPGGIAAAVDHDGSFVFIDTSGNVIARAYGYDNGPDYFQEGHARIVDEAKKLGFINERGQITIAPRFDEAESFCGGKAAVREAGQQLYIDKRGQPTSPPAEPPPSSDDAAADDPATDDPATDDAATDDAATDDAATDDAATDD